MNRQQSVVGIGLFLLCVGGGLSLGVSASDRETKGGQREGDVAPVRNALYSAECGSCHFAYQPGWLPARSWERVLAELSQHFGENAEVSGATQGELRQYLTAQAADRVDGGRSQKMVSSIQAGEVPVRVTETRYFQHKHREMADTMRAKKSQIGSLSQCNTCHTKAEQGSFNEHEVQIPGIGRWED